MALFRLVRSEELHRWMRIANHFRLLRCITPWRDGKAVFEGVLVRAGPTDTGARPQFAVKLYRNREEFEREEGVLRKVGKHPNVIELSAALLEVELVGGEGVNSIGTMPADEGKGSGSSKVGVLAFPFVETKEKAFAWVAASPDRIRSLLRQLLQVLYASETCDACHLLCSCCAVHRLCSTYTPQLR